MRAWVIGGLLVAVLCASPVLAADKRECIQASDDGQALRLDGKLSAAREKFLVCAQPSCPTVVTSACAEWLTEVDRQIPSVLVTLRDASAHDIVGATLAVDGAAPRPIDGRPLSLDPGTHELRALAPDGRAASQSVVLREGEQRRAIDLVVAATGASSPSVTSPSRPVPWAAIATTAVAGVAWATFAGFAISGHLQYRDLSATCGSRCTADQVRPVDTKFWVADVTLGVAVAATVLATVLFLVAPKSKPATAWLTGAQF